VANLTGDASKNRIFAMMIDNLLAMAISVPIGARIPGIPNSIRWLLISLVYLGYFAVSEAIWSKTIGKKLFNLKIVRMNGEPLSWTDATVRSLLRLVEVNPFLLGALPGALTVMFSTRKQRIGDMLAKTLVVRKTVTAVDIVDDHPVPGRPPETGCASGHPTGVEAAASTRKSAPLRFPPGAAQGRSAA